MVKLASNIIVVMVSVSAFVLCAVPTVFSDPTFQRLFLPGFGPDSSTFDSAGEGPYTTIYDGRIVKYTNSGFVEYAHTAENRIAKICDGTNSTDLIRICGRGLGLGFYYKTGELFVVDLLGGLLVVPPGGGLAKVIATSADGVPFLLLDAIEVDQRTGIVYFTDLSSKYNISQITQMIINGDASGRLLKYDPETKNVTVLQSGLAAPAGVAISADGSYLVFTELLKNRVQKYWLKGPNANTAQIIVNLSGSPDNIKRNEAGDFWIAVTIPIQGSGILQGQKINGNGTLLQKINFTPEFTTLAMSEVNEHKGYLYLGSLLPINYIGLYKYK